ncbi:MAG TPA: acyl carrier protein [Candidatus Hydrogenedentes bacterium]|nr:acyl carrier protein [Candidatus Hydrogenedentota bacterium]HOS02778.1 acyl carrier protein [Candidatus Hydrogenedentota bacterium]
MSDVATPELKREIRELIVACLALPDAAMADIEDAASLFDGSGKITLDSVDALEIVMALQSKYAVRIDDQNLARTVVYSVNSIAEFIAAQGKASRT